MRLFVNVVCKCAGGCALQMVVDLEISVCIGNSRLNSCKHAAGCLLICGHLSIRSHTGQYGYIVLIPMLFLLGVNVVGCEGKGK